MECVEGHAVALGPCADCLASEPLGEAIAAALRAKLQKNKTRQWPDWRTAPQDEPIEHVREGT